VHDPEHREETSMIGADALSASGLEIDAAHGSDLAAASLGLARRFSAGATMWCIAPSWPQHARHVAVEFVHPVIVGKRAFPAVAVTGPHPVDGLRSVVRAGDVLCAISTADEPVVVDALRRAPAWGLETLWIGWGASPPAGAAGNVLFVDDRDGYAPYDGSLVLRYHVLWELTHVCFEHPGLVRTRGVSDDGADTCITCADEGRVGEVVADVAAGDAIVRTARGLEQVDVTLVGPVQAGALLLVHAGAAIALLDTEPEHD
jgi:hydrogenase maturation factor